MIELTVKKYQNFGRFTVSFSGDLISPSSWEKMRMEEAKENVPYYLPEKRELWIQKCQKNLIYKKRAEIIVSLLSGYHRINSYGVGCAYLEYFLKIKKPEIYLQCSDYTPKTLSRLKSLFWECDELRLFDMLTGSWENNGPECLYLFHRIDTEFDDIQLTDIMQKMNLAKIVSILFIPGEMRSLPAVFLEQGKYLLRKALNIPLACAGYLRTKGRMEKILGKYYAIEKIIPLNGVEGYLLKSNSEHK